MELLMELNIFIKESIEDHRKRVFSALRDLTLDEMYWQPKSDTNPIGFLFWHTSRVEDRLITNFVQGKQEIWISDGWYEKTNLSVEGTGLGYSLDELNQFPKLGQSALTDYFSVVRKSTIEYLDTMSERDFDLVLDRIPFPEYKPAIEYFKGFTVARAFRQLIGELDQHLGQISYIRGIQKGMNN
tara:strand:- start:10997 stop:11551 length:555 start_codon:yes stop_codon:yes gene_type:complete